MRYRLYIILPQNIPEGEKYYLITAQYCLLYTNAETVPDGAVEYTKINKLPELAKEWLAECIDNVRKRALAEQKESLLTETAPAFYAALRDALEAESMKLKKDKETEG